MALGRFVPTLMPIIKLFVDKAFRERTKSEVYENEHLLYVIVHAK
jgi:hypothetical protein